MAARGAALDRLVASLLNAAGATSIPVNVEAVASSLGAQVHAQPLENDVSGVLAIKGTAKHIIVNALHHDNRKRFTIAHEIGHLVLHHGTADRLFIDKQLTIYQRIGTATSTAYTNSNSTTTPEEEREANRFASALLMPAEQLRQTMLDLGFDLFDELDVSRLAGLFQVSEQAMSIRLQQLELVSPLK